MGENLRQLRSGASEPDVLVEATMMALDNLLELHPIAFYELVMKARDPRHECYGNTGQLLKSLNLLESSGFIHGAIRDVILAAVDGEDREMTLVSPRAKE